jgi:hypothetical protein
MGILIGEGRYPGASGRAPSADRRSTQSFGALHSVRDARTPSCAERLPERDARTPSCAERLPERDTPVAQAKSIAIRWRGAPRTLRGEGLIDTPRTEDDQSRGIDFEANATTGSKALRLPVGGGSTAADSCSRDRIRIARSPRAFRRPRRPRASRRTRARVEPPTRRRPRHTVSPRSPRTRGNSCQASGTRERPVPMRRVPAHSRR